MARRLPLFRTVVGLGLALVGTTVVVLCLVRIDRVVTAPGALEGGTISVRMPHDGIVDEVLVGAAEYVRSGQALARLATAELDAEHARVAARLALLDEQLANVRAEVERLERNVHPAEATRAEREIERADIKFASSAKRVELLKRLEGDGLVKAIEVEDAELGRRLAEVETVEAREASTLLVTRQRATVESLQGRERELLKRRAEEVAQRVELERKRAAATVTADVSGIVVADRLNELPGTSITAGQELLRVATARPSHFVANLADTARTKAAPNDVTQVRLEAYPWLLHGVLAGRVDSVAERRNTDGFQVRIVLSDDAALGPLFEGMTGEARIQVAESVSLGRLLLEKLVGPLGP